MQYFSICSCLVTSKYLIIIHTTLDVELFCLFTNWLVLASLIYSNMFLMLIIDIYQQTRIPFSTIPTLFHLLVSLFLLLMFVYKLICYCLLRILIPLALIIYTYHHDKSIICFLINLSWLTSVCLLI